VRLPRLTDHSPAAALTEAPQGPARRAFDILVVDDNTDAAEMLSLSLQAAGHRVRVADGSFPALVEARRSPPEVCLLDIGLPDLDGYGLASQLRADPLTRAAILIAITGYGQDKDREAALAAGFDHHFAKPVDLAELQRAMDDARHRRAPANTVLGPQRTDP
jgi:CheY-like chemotaxis protein